MSQSSQAPDISQLFQTAHEEDTIGVQALGALNNVVDLGAKISDALGTPADQFAQSEIVLVSKMIDDSGSIRFSGLTDIVREGSNFIDEALADTKQAEQTDNIHVMTRLLNGQIINPFCSVLSAIKLTTSSYNPSMGTPLYDGTVEFLGAVMAKSQEYADQGIPCRTISLLLTDGEDVHSPVGMGGKGTTPADCAALIRDMLAQETHIIAGFGVEEDSNRGRVNFRDVFKSMGIPDAFIMEVKWTKPDGTTRTYDEFKSEVRSMFQVYSKSAVRASQNAASFSQQAMGGLGS